MNQILVVHSWSLNLCSFRIGIGIGLIRSPFNRLPVTYGYPLLPVVSIFDPSPYYPIPHSPFPEPAKWIPANLFNIYYLII